MILAITCSLSACAVAHSGPDGSVRVVGLADVQVTPAERSNGITGNVVTIQTVGLTLSLMDTVADLAIGYYHGRLALLRNCRPTSTRSGLDVDIPRWRTASDRGYDLEHDLRKFGKRFLGLVDITVPFSAAASQHGGTLYDSEVLGLGFAQRPKGLQVVVGYSHSTLLTIERDVVVKLGREITDCPMSVPYALRVGSQ